MLIAMVQRKHGRIFGARQATKKEKKKEREKYIIKPRRIISL